MNLLILSAGTRNKVVRYFKDGLRNLGNVIATDMSRLAPAIYEADRFYIVPPMTDQDYLESILRICEQESIDGVLSLIDPELSLLAKNSQAFDSIGTQVLGSPYSICERSLDKYQMFKWLKSHGYNCAETWKDGDSLYEALESQAVHFPVFVKPVRGSASINITRVDTREALDYALQQDEGIMVQEFLDGQEIGADVYIDAITGEVVSIFTKKKLKMRAGETDKAVSFKDPALFDFIRNFVTEAGYVGQIDIDIFSIDGDYFISEVNPRFGGGYPHAHEAGCNHIELIINNLRGIANKPNIGNYDEGIYMMKFNEIRLARDLAQH